MLKVSLWKGVIRFGKLGKLNPRYIRHFRIIAKVGMLTYRLELLEQLSRVYSTFRVSNLKKCFVDEPLAISLDEIQIDDKLYFIKEPVKIMDREVKRLKQSRIPIVKAPFGGVTQSWGTSSCARAMIELRVDLELKDNIVVAMPKLTREGHYICNVRVEYEWKPPGCASCKVFGHIHEECPKNTGVGEKKTLKKPSQTSRGVPVGPKMGFKPQMEYRLVPKKPNASSSGNKKKGVVHTIEVSNSNPFEVLNLVDNDVELSTNEGTTSLFEELRTSGKTTLVDEGGNPVKNVEYPEDCDSEDEVASVDNDMAHSMASERVGFGTQSLPEQWRDSYGNGNYDEDPYDDDMYVTGKVQWVTT
ncbi:hypothetical protein Tco_1018548, partial [Tanacetum coccineum]